MAPGPAVVLALGLRKGVLTSIAVTHLDPGLQDLTGSCRGYCLCALYVLCGSLIRFHGPFYCSPLINPTARGICSFLFDPFDYFISPFSCNTSYTSFQNHMDTDHYGLFSVHSGEFLTLDNKFF